MKHLTLTFIISFFAFSFIYAQSQYRIKKYVLSQLENYPKIHLQDIYKSCYQDFMGAEHIISNKETVYKCIATEIETMDDTPNTKLSLEPCGIYGKHIRFELSMVKNGEINTTLLTDLFIESVASTKKHTIKEWIKRWKRIENVIDKMKISLPNQENEKLFIRQLFERGEYACSHSQEYRESYNPHYRIVSKRVLKIHKIKLGNNSRSNNR